MALLNKVLPIAGFFLARRFAPRIGPAGVLLGGGRRTMAGLATAYLAKKAFDVATRNRRVHRAY
jgi:hypothetical protein